MSRFKGEGDGLTYGDHRTSWEVKRRDITKGKIILRSTLFMRDIISGFYPEFLTCGALPTSMGGVFLIKNSGSLSSNFF